MWYERDGPRPRREASICGKRASHQMMKTILALLAHELNAVAKSDFFLKHCSGSSKNRIDTD